MGRVKNPQSDITAVGRSALEVTQEEEEDAEIEEEALEIVAEISRKRRQLQQEEEGSGAAVQSRLSNVYIPEDQKKEEEVTGRDLQSDAEAAVNLTEEEEQLLLKIK